MDSALSGNSWDPHTTLIGYRVFTIYATEGVLLSGFMEYSAQDGCKFFKYT